MRSRNCNWPSSGLRESSHGSHIERGITLTPSFLPNMTAGRGYMALAAMIFGKWHPVGALWACLLFGFLDAVAIRLQGAPLPLIGPVPVQAIQALPYVLTVVLLAGFIGRAHAPAALGRPAPAGLGRTGLARRQPLPARRRGRSARPLGG